MIFSIIAGVLDLQNDSSERRHSRDNHTFSPDTQYDWYVAKSTCRDASTHRQLVQYLPPPNLTGETIVADNGEPDATPHDARYPMFDIIEMYYHNICVQRCKANDETHDYTHPDFWHATKLELFDIKGNDPDRYRELVEEMNANRNLGKQVKQ